MGFLKSAEEARKVLEARDIVVPKTADVSAVVADLQLQWHDHFHMRDQTWKTLNISALIFVGVVGLEIYKGTPAIVMIAAYSALVLVSVVGFLVSAHHRHIQKNIKFPIIIRYEVLLGLSPAFEDIIEKHSHKGLSTSTFILVSHGVLGAISLLLLGRKVCEAAGWCATEYGSEIALTCATL